MDQSKDRLELDRKRIIGYILISVLFIVVSFSTFIGVKILYSIIVNEGRTSLYTIPAVFTYLIPLVTFYFILVSMYAKTVKGRLKFIQTLGLILLAVSLFDLIAIFICCGLLWNWNVIINMVTPLFPLDVILINILYLILALGLLLYKRIDHKYVLSVGVSSIPLSTSLQVGFAFYIAPAAYFFGQFIFGLIFLRELYIDPNWMWMIPHYLLFVLPSITFTLFLIARYIRDIDKKIKFAKASLISSVVMVCAVFAWLITGMIVNPYLIQESLQWEYGMLLTISKVPGGIFVIAIMMIIVIAIGYRKYYQFSASVKKSKENE